MIAICIHCLIFFFFSFHIGHQRSDSGARARWRSFFLFALQFIFFMFSFHSIISSPFIYTYKYMYTSSYIHCQMSSDCSTASQADARGRFIFWPFSELEYTQLLRWQFEYWADFAVCKRDPFIFRRSTHISYLDSVFSHIVH